jgi:hypothetical protein
VSGITTNSVTINSINSLDYQQYTSGGVLEYNTPVDLSPYSGRMQIRESLDSEVVIHELTTVNGGILLDNVNKVITMTIPAETTENFEFTSAVYSLELVSGIAVPVVTPLITGNITLTREVTR